jgi:hypothetical protein
MHKGSSEAMSLASSPNPLERRVRRAGGWSFTVAEGLEEFRKNFM